MLVMLILSLSQLPLNSLSLFLSLSCQALTELISTYTSDSEDDIATYVKELVVMAISDPDRYIFSELLEIEAVKLQYSEKIYQVRFNVIVIKFVSVCYNWANKEVGSCRERVWFCCIINILLVSTTNSFRRY